MSGSKYLSQQVPPPPQWVTVSLPSGFAAAVPIRYCKINGIVYLQGTLTTLGTTGTTIFTLPVGFRPSVDGRYNGNTGSATPPSSVVIQSNGAVQPYYGAVSVVSFQGISFPAEG